VKAWLVLWCGNPRYVATTRSGARRVRDDMAYRDGLFMTEIVPCEFQRKVDRQKKKPRKRR
jgi:hypothetical protein